MEKKIKINKVHKTLRFSEELLKKIDDISKIENRTFSNIVQTATQEYTNKKLGKSEICNNIYNSNFDDNTYDKFRLDKNLDKQIRDFCNKNNRSISNFCRLAIQYFLSENNENKIFEKDIKFKKQVLFELKRWGNNFNQIAHNLNIAMNETDDVEQKRRIESAINDHQNLRNDVIELNKLIDKRL